MELNQIKILAEKGMSPVTNQKDLEAWRIKYLGRKGELSIFFDSFKNLSLKEKKEQGDKANRIRQFLTSLYEQKKTDLEVESLGHQIFDITRPGQRIKKGHLHPLTLILREIVHSFEKIGFEIIEGPEIETEYYNFDALRIPENHPARDMWDTFWINSKLLLRTHTSPMQIRYMEKHQPPLRIIVPGKCFRFEATDTHHEFQFHQVEGLMIGENISLANFKFIIREVIEDIFKHQVELRFRPSYFPFVTPGLEVDIKMKSKANNEWLEIMGAGMVHSQLFKNVGYETNHWQGFAFGLGVERIAMIKYGIDDIRLFFGSDIRFLEQF
ncbi:phenylalanine--tRNA ligase subunit alpha [Candidatus Parcubacteria bacterium]|nr:phenylalanine--tRNA ligase subunit alpha [Candidatus Parcubacteria bacterium]